MAVWTISAELGAGGLELACELASAADVPLLDRKALSAVAHDLEPGINEDDDDLEARVCSRLRALLLGAAISAGSADAVHEFQLRQTLPDLGRSVLGAAARNPAVILAPAAFAALADHPSAVHVRLRAPFDWRVAAYRREEVVDRRCAEKAVHHDDHAKRAWVRKLYHVDLDDPAHFSLVLDVSRFSRAQVVDTLLAAGATHAAL